MTTNAMKQRQKPRWLNSSEFRYQSFDQDSDSDNEVELLNRSSSFKETPTVFKSVEEGDTLQALSIRYRCPISELKRMNNIHRENEVFARKFIKVPLRPFTMALASVHSSGTQSPEETALQEVDANLLKNKLSTELLGAANLNMSIVSNIAEVNQIIFNSSIKPVPKNCDNIIENSNVNNISDEQISLLPRNDVSTEVVVSRLSCSGADADISWIALVICIVIVIIVFPLIYVFYIYEHPDQYHHADYS